MSSGCAECQDRLEPFRHTKPKTGSGTMERSPLHVRAARCASPSEIEMEIYTPLGSKSDNTSVSQRAKSVICGWKCRYWQFCAIYFSHHLNQMSLPRRFAPLWPRYVSLTASSCVCPSSAARVAGSFGKPRCRPLWNLVNGQPNCMSLIEFNPRC